MTTTDQTAILLSHGGVAVVFRTAGTALPEVVYWGGELGERGQELADQLAASASPAVMNSSLDTPRRFAILPTEAEGWSGSPGIAGHLAGRTAASRFSLDGVDRGPDEIAFRLRDDRDDFGLTLRYRLDEFGVLTASARLVHNGGSAEPYDLESLRLLLPLPARAAEILDFSGRWSRERQPQRMPVADGAHRRAVRRGRPGHDSPLLSVVGTPAFGFRHGEVWAAHVAWSGDQEYLVERLPEGAAALSAVLGGGELLRAGEIRLAAGESYETPPIVFTWSDRGLDGLSERLHAHVRAFPAHPDRPRPVVLNTWEAVYFDHDVEKLAALARVAAGVGVERFVLDDGWFLGRRDDRGSLGDWWVDPDVWPDGLGELAETVHGLGMEFGLWFEPEMLSMDSTVARQHPEWLLAPSAGTPPDWRHQQVLNVAHPEAWAFLAERIGSLVDEYGIDFIKWDHNRDLHEAVWRDPVGDRPAVHAQTAATYALFDTLRARRPGLEIESCASGGARVDLGVLRHTQRIWASDTNDPIERQSIQRWTGLLVPPELVGSHIGPEESHTTHRVSTLAFRLTTALFGHGGLEWDLTGCSADELAAIADWAGLYKELRPLLHSGVTVRADLQDDALLLHGVVSADGTDAVYAWVALATTGRSHSERVPFPGLRDDLDYRVTLRTELGPVSRHQVADPEWMSAPAVYSGRVLRQAGLPLPVLNPGGALVLRLEGVR